MKRYNLALILQPFYIFFILILISSCQDSLKQEPASKEQVLRHMVLFKFADSTSAEKVNSIEQGFAALPDKIPQIIDYEWGLNNSPEGLDMGFTHCFLLSFASEDDRAIYLPHPDHQAFVDLLKPHLEEVLVVDYWTSD